MPNAKARDRAVKYSQENLMQTACVLAECVPGALEKNLFPNSKMGCPRPEHAWLLLAVGLCILI